MVGQPFLLLLLVHCQVYLPKSLWNKAQCWEGHYSFHLWVYPCPGETFRDDPKYAWRPCMTTVIETPLLLLMNVTAKPYSLYLYILILEELWIANLDSDSLDTTCCSCRSQCACLVLCHQFPTLLIDAFFLLPSCPELWSTIWGCCKWANNADPWSFYTKEWAYILFLCWPIHWCLPYPHEHSMNWYVQS